MNRIKFTIVVFLILIIAATFRFTGVNWDDNAHLNPDERFLTMVTTSVSWPKTITEYFDTNSSPLNPHNRGYNFYVYGTYPMIFTKLVATLIHKDTYDGITIVGRTLSGIVDLLTLVVVYLMAGHLAAFCYAIMVLPIQLSHFFTVDPYATFFTTLVLYRIFRNKFDAATGVALALAVGAKMSAILISPIIGIAYVMSKPRKNPIWFVLGFILTLRVVYPYLFDGFNFNHLVLDNWRQLKAFDGVNTTFPPALQWIGVGPIQPFLDLIFFGLGIPMGILAFFSLWNRKYIVLTIWVLLLLGYQSFQFAKAMRYLWPMYPALAVLIGLYLSSARRSFVTLLLGISLMVWPLAFIHIYTHPTTRITASTWIYAHIPQGKTIAWESWDDPLPLAIHSDSINQYHTISLTVYDPDNSEKWHKLTKSLTQTDYLVLSSNRVYGGTGRAKKRYPITARYYRLLFSNNLGFTTYAEFTSRPTLPFPRPVCLPIPGFSYGLVNTPACTNAGIQLIDDGAEESFTVYDHPKVTILKNTGRLSDTELFTKIYE